MQTPHCGNIFNGLEGFFWHCQAKHRVAEYGQKYHHQLVSKSRGMLLPAFKKLVDSESEHADLPTVTLAGCPVNFHCSSRL